METSLPAGFPYGQLLWHDSQVTWLLDCDGVIWLADDPIAGAHEAVRRLREAGERVIFLTNNSHPRRRDHLEKLARLKIPSSPSDIVSSAMAAARLVKAGERALVLGGPGLHEELEARGADVLEPGEGDPTRADVVVVGMDLGFNFQRLAAATTALRAGARLVATNEDATFPTSHGLLPGSGSVVAAVATAGGVEPIVAGKPYQPVADLLGEIAPDVSIMVGDRPSTDGAFARRLGVSFGLVLTGVTPPGH
ncbi:MAG: HAD-IIA family hydrolase, partial [Acidimicrobiales bacterium]